MVIDCEKIFIIFLFCIYKFPQVTMLVGVMDVYQQGFYHVKTSIC
jgi:hypothetical protein